jgi:very-short-patch-repair endonuclease
MHEENGLRDWRLAELAARQYGVVGYRQLVALGFGRGAIEHRVRTGRLHRLHKGVYAVGHRAITIEGRRLAAVLACGPGAALARWSAAAHWELLRPVAVIDVVVPGRGERRRGIRVQRAALHARDLARHRGIPVTSVSRTLLDIAATARPNVLARAVNEADRRGRLDRPAVHDLLERNHGRRGTKQLRSVIAALDPATRRTRSDLEAIFLRVCKRFRLPTPNARVEIAGVEVDFHFPGTRLIVEIDSYEYHRTPREFENDRRRDAHLKRRGYEVLRVGEAWLVSDPAGVAATVRELIELCAA